MNYVNYVLMCWYQAQHTISVTSIVTGSLTGVGVRWVMHMLDNRMKVTMNHFFFDCSLCFHPIQTEPCTYSRVTE